MHISSELPVYLFFLLVLITGNFCLFWIQLAPVSGVRDVNKSEVATCELYSCLSFVSFLQVIIMAHVLVASSRNWRSFTQFLKLSVRRMPLANFAVHSRRPVIDTIICVPTLRQLTLCDQISHFSSYPASKRWQTFMDIDLSFRSVRKISSSKTERDKGSETSVDSSESSDSSSEGDDTLSSDSRDDSLKTYDSEPGSTHKAQPVSDVDVDKELLRYDYEEFELIPDEEVSIVQPVKESIPVELESKWCVLFARLLVNVNSFWPRVKC